MSAISQTMNQVQGNYHSEPGMWKKIKTMPLSEAFWFTSSLVLFVVMGPFAAIPATISVFSLAGKQDGQAEPKAA